VPCNKSCTIMDECFKKYRNNLKPPCASDTVESAPSASTNSDYTAAILAELIGWRDRQGLYSIDGTMLNQLADRLNAAIRPLHCA
jgi:hypothetical protein